MSQLNCCASVEKEETSGEYVISQIERLKEQCRNVLGRADVKLKGVAFDAQPIPSIAMEARALPPYLEVINNNVRDISYILNELANLLDRIDL